MRRSVDCGSTWTDAVDDIRAVGVVARLPRARSTKERTWDDLTWAAHPVTLVYQQRRVSCRRCGIRTERIEFVDAQARVTRRLRQQIGVDCQSTPTSHAAVGHGVSWGKAQRAEKAFLAEWDRTRPKRQPRHIGLDEIHRRASAPKSVSLCRMGTSARMETASIRQAINLRTVSPSVRFSIDAPICQDDRSGGFTELLARAEVSHDALIDFPSEKAFKASDDVPFRPSIRPASDDIVDRRLVIAHTDHDGSMEGGVRLSVAAPIEAVSTGGHPGGGGDGTRAAELGKGGCRANPLRVIPEDN